LIASGEVPRTLWSYSGIRTVDDRLVDGAGEAWIVSAAVKDGAEETLAVEADPR